MSLITIIQIPQSPHMHITQGKKKKNSHFKGYSTTQNTPLGALHTIYDLYHNYVSKVSFGEKCQLGLKEFKSFFFLCLQWE